MLNLGFDLDSVIARTSEAIIDSLKRVGVAPQDYCYDQTTSWNLEWNEETKTGIPGVTMEDLSKVFTNSEFWATIKPYTATAALVNELYRTTGLYIITDRRWYDALEKETALWLRRNKIKYDQLIIAKGKEKWRSIIDNKIDFFVDDNATTIRSIAPYVRGAYLFAQPWNANETDLPENCVRVGIRDLAQDLKAYCAAEELIRSAAVLEQLTCLAAGRPE